MKATENRRQTPAAERNRTAQDDSIPPNPPTQPADLLVRNYDIERLYRVRLCASRRDADHEYETRYRLHPGQVVAEFGVLDSGEYDVSVDLGGTGSHDTQVELPAASDGTLLVEVGNGVVTVNEGPY